MKRVRLCLSLLAVFLVGPQWLGAPAHGQSDDPCPAADMGYDGHSGCPNLDEMRAYGECHWYYEQYPHGATADAAADCPAVCEREAPADCWYDCETEEYYPHEFSQGADQVAADAVEDDAMQADALEDVTTDEFAASEDVADEEAADESIADSVMPEASAWDDEAYDYDYGYEDDYPMEGGQYAAEASGDAKTAVCETVGDEMADDEMAGDAASMTETEADESVAMDDDGAWEEDSYSDFTEDCEEAMESTCDETKSAWPSGEYDYRYGGYPYGYDYYQDYESRDSEPVQAWEDADLEMTEVEDDEEAVPPPPASDMVQLDTEVILSLARTLDRLGCTLQSLSGYLTEMATADMAQRQGTLHR